MSQHLITTFINQNYTFKALNGAKLVSHKLKKYDPSNRNNNNSPEDIAESVHILQKIKVEQKKAKDESSNSIIDITV